MLDEIDNGIDPDLFQIFLSALSAFADLATVLEVARDVPGSQLAFDPKSSAAEPVRMLRNHYEDLFAAMDKALRVFGQYDGSMRNVDRKLRIGFGSFLTNLTQPEFREYKDLRQKINLAALQIGLWTATIIEQMPNNASAFSKAAILNHTELNDILRGDLTYSELALRYRDLKERVETFFEGIFKRGNF